MFELGQDVVSTNGHRGKVVFVEDDYVCIETRGGGEMDFPAADLKLWVEPVQEKPAPSNVDAKGLFNLPYQPRRGDRKLAEKVIDKIGQILPPFIRWAENHIDGYNELEAFDKVKAISEATGTPMVVWMGAGDLGDDGFMRSAIYQTLMNQMSNGDGLVADMLLDQALETVKRWEDYVNSDK